MTRIEEAWSTSRDGEKAKQLRDTRARELRKQGWTVKCEKWDFSDLARAIRYTLTATRQEVQS